MNRRNFLTQLGQIGLFSILPGTGRVWKAERKVWILNPEWETATHGFYEPQGPLHLSPHPYQDYFNSTRYQEYLRKTYEIFHYEDLFKPKVWPQGIGDVTS